MSSSTLTAPNRRTAGDVAGETLYLTTAQALVLYLSRQKVEMFDGTTAPLLGGIWGIFGHGNVAGMGEALWQMRDELPYHRGNNEQGMAHAAIAFAKAHRARRCMAVTTSIGPGATNMVTAAALAHTNRLPVLFLPGDHYASRRPDPVLQQLEDPTTPLLSVNDTFAPVSRYFDRICRPEQLLQSLPEAVRVLTSPVDRGPVTLALPQDVQAEAFHFPAHLFEERIHYLERPRPDSRALARAAAVLQAAERPVIIAGGGVHYSAAEGVLAAFSEKHAIPVAETQAGKTSLPWDHPQCLGGVGVTGTAAANEIVADADVVVCVGTRLSDFTTASKALFHRPETRMIGINTTAFDATKGGGVAVIGDAKVVLEELSERLAGYRAGTEQEVDQVITQWHATRDAVVAPQPGIPTDAQVLAAVNTITDDCDVVVGAAGGLPGELHKLWRSRDPIGYHLEYAYSCMGYEVAGGLGVKMAHPDREVYVLVGDGSYLMMHTELYAAVQHGLKVNVVLLDNGGFGCINRLQQGCGSPRFGNLFSRNGSAVRVDFVKNAESYGCHAQKVSTIAELSAALAENRARDVSCVTVIETDPEAASPGYAWWDVAIAERSAEEGVVAARRTYEDKLEGLYGVR